MTTTLVSVIIVNWNAKKYLKDCIESIISQSLNDFEIILVDNNSSDDSVQYVKKTFPQVRIIQNNQNLGFAEGNNIGIKNSNGQFIALFNPDAVADKNWLSNLIHILQTDSNIAGVTGKMYYLGDQYDKETVFCTWSKIDPISANPTNFHDNEPMSNVDYLSGAAMIIRRDVLEKTGFLDSEYFLYFEETDLCARLIRAGYVLTYVPNAIVWHAVSPTMNSSIKIYYMERNRIRFAMKNFDSSYIIPFFLVFLGESILIFLRDLKNFNFMRTKIRLRAWTWNLRNLRKTFTYRQQCLSMVKKSGILQSFNKNLPLRFHKTR